MRKACKDCGKVKTLQEFNGPWTDDGRQRWDARCRLCRKAYNRRYYLKTANSAKVKPHSKVCISCDRELLAKHFSAHRGRPGGLQSDCNQCRAEKQRLTIFRKQHSRVIVLPDEKTCCRCGKTKPALGFYRQSARNDGLAGACKACCYSRKNARRGGHEVLEPTVTEKWCPGCLDVRPAEDFPRSKRTKSGLWSYCRECENERKREMRARVKAELAEEAL